MRQIAPLIRFRQQASRWWTELFGPRPARQNARPAMLPAPSQASGDNGSGAIHSPRVADRDETVATERYHGETAPVPVEHLGLPSDLTGLEKQIARLGREQFKLNALIERQQQQLQTALQQLSEQDERRENERTELLARRRDDLAEARLQVIQQLLPVLDGLDQALAAGEGLSAHAPSPTQIQELTPSANRPRLWTRLMKPNYEQQQRAATALATEVATWHDSLVAWLRGLALVRERLLATLAAENVYPIPVRGQRFDPHLHIAIDTVANEQDTPNGTIVTELRRGYVTDNHVLRYAEVIVARATEPITISTEELLHE